MGVALVALGVSGGASALEGYCLAPDQTTDDLALTDVTFSIGATNYSPTDCYGITDTGASNISDALDFVNDLRWEDFVDGVKDNVDGGSNSVTVDSILYTLTAEADTGTGTNQISHWTLSWSDTNGVNPPNLPLLVNFALDWKGGNNDVFYLFQNILLPVSPTSGSGTIDITVLNNPGNSDLGTSHLDVFFSDTRPVPDPDPNPDPTVPEPGTLLLIATTLVGMAAARRRLSRS